MGRYPCIQAIIKAEQRFPSTQFTFTYVGNGEDSDENDDEDGDMDDDEDDDEHDDEHDDRLLFLEPKITSDLDANLATISRLPIPAARIRAVNPYLLARLT